VGVILSLGIGSARNETMNIRLGKRLAAIVAAFGLMGSVFAQTEPVYADSLAPGCSNWSWATVNLGATEFVHSGTKSIGVTTGGWTALYLHHAPLDTTMLNGLSFWIHGGTTGGQLLQVQALRNGGSHLVVQLPPLAASWQKVTISLAQLGVEGVQDLDGFWIQSRTSASQPTFYVDDIQWDGKPIPDPISVNVNTSARIRTVDGRIFGLNTNVWDQAYNSAGTVALLKSLGTKLLRFPGGSLADEYHWATGRSFDNSWAWVNNFDTFANIATQIGAKAIITVNYGTGTPQEAAEWVRYANITKGLGYKYWEIGNEVYGDWETDWNNRPHDPITYANRAAQYIQAMKAVDPTIRIGVVGSSHENEWQNYPEQSVVNPRTKAVVKGWMPLVLNRLRQLGVVPNFVVHHKYDQLPFQENDKFLLKSAASWADDAARLRQMLIDYMGATNAARIELVCTENNSVTSNPGKQSTSLVNGLFLCDSLGQILKTEFNMNCWWGLRNGTVTGTNMNPSLYGWRQYGDYGLVTVNDDRHPSFFGQRMRRYFVNGGDAVYPVTTDYAQLSAYATGRSDGSYRVMVINKSPNLTLTGRIRIPGAPSVTVGRRHTYGIPQDQAAGTGVGSPEIDITSDMNLGPDFTASFAPYSVTVFEVSSAPAALPRPPAVPGTLTASLLSNSQVKLDWIDRSTNEDGFKISVSTDGVKYNQVATVWSNVVSYTVGNLTPKTKYYLAVGSIGHGGESARRIVTVTTP